MHSAATISSKGQVTIPHEIRERLGLKQGDRVAFTVEDGKTVLRPLRSPNNPFETYMGALGAFKDADEVNAWLRELRDED